MSRLTAVPAPFRLTFRAGTLDLCNACAAVLLHEGTLVSPRGEEPVSMVGFRQMRCAPLAAHCDGCEAAAELAAHAPVLRAPPARLAGCPGEIACDLQNETYCPHHAAELDRWMEELPF